MERPVNVYYFGEHFYQRTPNSKILYYDKKGNIVGKFENRKQLPMEAKRMLEMQENLYNYPQNYFEYEVNPDGRTAILTNLKMVEEGDEVTNIIIPESIHGYTITGLDEYLFEDYPIESLIINSNITNIGNCLCGNCTMLRKVILPENITEIPPYCFALCDNLESIIIPEKVSKIGHNAFSDTKLSGEISFSDNLLLIEPDAFLNCNFSKIIVSKNTKIAESAFDFSQKLKIHEKTEVSTEKEKER